MAKKINRKNKISIKIYVFLFLLVFVQDFYGQSQYPNNFKALRTLGTFEREGWYYKELVNDYMKGVWLYLAYRDVSFLNSTFYNNKKNGNISLGVGGSLGISYVYYPFMVDLGVSYNLFWYEPSFGESYYGTHKSVNTYFSGSYLFISSFVLPNIAESLDRFQPFVGVGYSLYALGISKDNDEKKISTAVGDLSLKAPAYKVGIFIRLGEYVAILGEYRKTIFAESGRDYAEIVVGTSFRFNSLRGY